MAGLLLQLVSALTAFGAAYHWWRSAAVQLPLTEAARDRGALSEGLRQAARRNARAALYAAIAAATQGLSLLVMLWQLSGLV